MWYIHIYDLLQLDHCVHYLHRKTHLPRRVAMPGWMMAFLGFKDWLDKGHDSNAFLPNRIPMGPGILYGIYGNLPTMKWLFFMVYMFWQIYNRPIRILWVRISEYPSSCRWWFFVSNKVEVYGTNESVFRRYWSISHTIHVWYIYLHLVDFYGKCR